MTDGKLGEGQDVPLFIRRLMPNASPDGLNESARSWVAYEHVVWEVYKRLEAEGQISHVLEKMRKEREVIERTVLVEELIVLLAIRARLLEIEG